MNVNEKKISVLIVEDSISVQKLLAKIIGDDSRLQIIGSVSDGKEAIEFVKSTPPDVITMDILMPRMNGLDATRQIMRENPIPIIIITGKYTKEDIKIGFEAMEAGAVSIMEKPPGLNDSSYSSIARNIQKTIRSVAGIKLISRKYHSSDKLASKLCSYKKNKKIEAIAIGSSLGGPQVLKKILTNLPESFSIPIFIVQHIAEGFGEGFVDWLNKSISLDVVIPKRGELPVGGKVYVAPDHRHLIVTKERKLFLSDLPAINGLKPAVSLLFSSLLESYGVQSLGILLTGMGSDGSEELLDLHRQGATTIVQSKETCIAYGMPGHAVKLGAAEHLLSPEEIANFLVGLNSS